MLMLKTLLWVSATELSVEDRAEVENCPDNIQNIKFNHSLILVMRKDFTCKGTATGPQNSQNVVKRGGDAKN